MGRTPVCVYVLFHPKGPEGAPLARSLFDWLRLKVDTGDGLATGLPVYYRAVVEKERFQPSIDWEGADRSVVVVLVDDHMATDPTWRKALKALQAEAELFKALFLPVMVDRSLDQLAFLSERYQAVRIHDPADPVMPPASRDPAEERIRQDIERERLRLRSARLRRGVTEAIARRLRTDPATGRPSRLRVFVSHAKADGAEVAARVRDGLASVSQMESWFDVNDLATGSIWRQPMANAAGNSSGGMIVVLSDAYPTRPWCRLEARAARTPIRSRNLKNLYKVQPLVAVHLVGTRWTRAVGPLAQAPHIGWPTDPSDPVRERKLQQGRIADVVDRLLLEVLLAGLMRSVAQAHPNAVVLDFVPDAWSLAEIHKQIDRSQEPVHILYPGHGLRPAEREELERTVGQLFPRGSSLDAVEEHNLGLGRAPAEGRDVAISTGGESEELWPEGLAVEHVNDLLLRLTRQLLVRRHRCVFGGALGQQDNFTVSILDTAEAWSKEQPVEVPSSEKEMMALIARGDAAIERPPVLSHQAWPYSEQLSLKAQARYLGICDFVVHDRVDVLDMHRYATTAEFAGIEIDGKMSIAALDQKFSGSIRNLLVAESLAAMRREVSRSTHVRVLIAGKIHGWSGWLPGIAEELLGSLSQGQPVLLVGAFGGCAKVIADFLLSPKAAYPAELGYDAELAYRQRRGEEKAWLEFGTTEALRRQHFAELETALRGLRADLWPDQLQDYPQAEDERSARDLVLGVPRKPWIELAREAGATAVIGRVLRLVEGLKK